MSIHGRNERKTFAAAFIVLAFILIPGLAWANTYYVEPVSGNNGNTGGSGDPWKTIHYAYSQIAAGDVIILKNGTYNLSSGETDSPIGVSLANITIRAENPGNAIIDGIGALSWTNAFTVSSSDVTIKDLVIKRFQGGGLVFIGGSGFTVQGNTIYDNGTSGFGSYGVQMISSVSNTSVIGNTIYWSGDTNYKQWYGVQCSTVGSAVSITNNTIYGHGDATGYGVYLSDSPVNVSLNRIYDNRVGVTCQDSLSVTAMIWNNLIYKTSGTMETGILVNMISAGTTTPQIYHNTIDGGSLYGVRVTNTGSNPTVYYNMITNFSAGEGISAQGFAAPDLRYNNLYGNGTNHAGVSPGTGDASVAPGYVSSSDYHLQASSAAIGLVPSGESDPVTADFEGNPRAAGTPRDPGAYEYTSEGGGGSSTSVTINFSPGTTADKYVIRSIPLSLADPSPSGAIGSQIGAYDITLMRIGHWDSPTQAYVEYPGNGGNIYPGDGIWFLFRYGGSLTFSGTTTPTSANPKDSFESASLKLDVGWNQVGNPFTHPVAVSNMVVSNIDGTPGAEDFSAGSLSQGIFWVYDSGVYYSASKLNVAEGGWVLKYNEAGKLWVKDISVSYPDVAADADPADKGYLDVAPDASRPPAPPGGVGSGWTSSGGGGGGGGGGGCFVAASKAADEHWPVALLVIMAGLAGLALLAVRKQ